jgi:hypothetical protein
VTKLIHPPILTVLLLVYPETIRQR